MAKKQSGDLRRYAVVGAEQRLLEIAEEAASIFDVFPEIRGRGRGLEAVRGAQSTQTSASGQPRRRPRRSTLSAEARKRISDAQKARWAKQKAQPAAPAPAAASARKKR